MNYPPKKVFILENGEYLEISFEELRWHTDHDIKYKDRLFLPLHGMLMEVTREDYEQFYREDRRQRYQTEVSINNGDISLDAISSGAFQNHIHNVETDVSEVVERRIMRKQLSKAIALLPEVDQLLIYQHYFLNMSEVRLAELYGVTQQSISWRIRRIQEQLKKTLS